MPQPNSRSHRFQTAKSRLRNGGWFIGLFLAFSACEVTELPPEPEKIVVAEFTINPIQAPDTVSWTIGTHTGWANLAKTDSAPKKLSFQASVAAPNPPDTVRFGLQALGMKFVTIDMAPQPDGSYLRGALVRDELAMKLLTRLDSLSKVSGSGYTRTRSGLQTMCAIALLDSTRSILNGQSKNLPAGLSKTTLDSLALREAAKGAIPLAVLSKKWLLDVDADQARAKIESWLAQGEPGIDSAAYRRLVPLENLAPQVLRLTADTLTVIKGGAKRAFVIEYRDDSGMTAMKNSVWQNSLDVSGLFSLDAPAFPTNKPTSWICTLKVATGTAALGAYTLKTEATDNKGQRASKDLTFQVADDGKVIEPPPVNHAPSVTRQDPLNKVVSVTDITPTMSFQWTVVDVDNNLSSVTLQDQSITLQNNIAKASLDLKIGDTTFVVLKAADQGGLEMSDTVRVYRAPAVKPTVQYLSGTKKDTTLPDTQSTFKVRWKVTDTDLDSVMVQGDMKKPLDGPEYEYVVHLGPGASDTVFLIAYDHYGVPVIDSVMVHRPDPRAKWKTVISAVQSGADTIPLIKLSAGLSMGQFEITRAVYAKYAGTTLPKDSLGYPVNNVSFYDAVLFCNALSKAKGLDTMYSYAASVMQEGYLDTVRLRSDTAGSLGPRVLTRDLAQEYSILTLAGQTSATFSIRWEGSNVPTVQLFGPDGTKLSETATTGIVVSQATNSKTYTIDLSKFPVGSWKMSATTISATPIVVYPTLFSLPSAKFYRKGYRLPTPSEWNAAVVQWGGPYCWGASTEFGIAKEYANLSNLGSVLPGSRLPTGDGFFDLAGNQAEWLSKTYGYSLKATRWAFIGGSFVSADLTTVSAMTGKEGTLKDPSIGFRVVRIGEN